MKKIFWLICIVVLTLSALPASAQSGGEGRQEAPSRRETPVRQVRGRRKRSIGGGGEASQGFVDFLQREDVEAEFGQFRRCRFEGVSGGQPRLAGARGGSAALNVEGGHSHPGGVAVRARTPQRRG